MTSSFKITNFTQKQVEEIKKQCELLNLKWRLESGEDIGWLEVKGKASDIREIKFLIGSGKFD